MPFNEASAKALFTAKYNTAAWKHFLRDQLDWDIHFHDPAQPIEIRENGVVDALEIGYLKVRAQVGFLTLTEEKIPLMEVRLTGFEIDRNRVGLNTIARKAYHEAGQRDLLVVFYGLDRAEWRFSFMSSEGEWGAQNTDAKRYTYVFGIPETHHTSIEQFRQTAGQGKDLSLKTLKEAFSVEKVSIEFFKKYKAQYETIRDDLTLNGWSYFSLEPQPLTGTAEHFAAQKPIRDFTKRFMGRLIFLQFLQKKGWMGCPASTDPDAPWEEGNKDFLLFLYDKVTKESRDRFYCDYLYQLFFETLNNKDREHYSFSPPNIDPCRVPYLNGGLFEIDPELDKRYIPLKDALIKSLLDFFAEYNFTIEENRVDDHEVGIDPEMLGHIFENLLDDNRERGTFYTPKLIVQYMCQEALVHYLAGNNLPEAATGDFVRGIKQDDGSDIPQTLLSEAEKLDKRLRAIKVCDPAIGSGAFPMGMLTEILQCRQRLHPVLVEQGKAQGLFNVTAAKKAIIQNSIYGVDIDGGAVDIARLRFWLSLVVDEERPEPLPNLDYKIMQGNSLLESFEGISLKDLAPGKEAAQPGVIEPNKDMFGYAKNPQYRMHLPPQAPKSLQKHITDYFSETDSSEKQKQRLTIDTEVKRHLAACIQEGLEKAKEDLQHAQDAWDRQPAPGSALTPAKEERNVKPRQNAKDNLDAAKATFERLKTALKRIHQLELTEDRPYFLWHLYFKDVMDTGGFDVVIANPPYFSLEGRIDEQIAYANYNVLAGRGDIYTLFYELGFNLLRKNGVLSFITSNSWMQAKYGKKLRQLISDKNQPLILLNFEDKLLFKEAIVETNILLAKKEMPKKFETSIIDEREVNVPVHSLKACTVDKLLYETMSLSEFVNKYSYTLTTLSYEGWPILSVEEVKLKNKMEAKGETIRRLRYKTNIGILTGCNVAYIIDESKKKELILKNPAAKAYIKPILKGRDLTKYKAHFGGQYIIVAGYGMSAEIMENSAIYEHLRTYEPALRKRGQCNDQPEAKRGSNYVLGETGQHHWLELNNNPSKEYLEQFDKPKIIWSRIDNNASFVYDPEGYYLLDTCFMLSCQDPLSLLPILNSKPVAWLFNCYALATGMGTSQWLKNKVELLTIPALTNSEKAVLSKYASKVLKDAKMLKSTILNELQIDQLVYSLYGLADSEVAIIERWWAAHYPKLAAVQLKELEALGPQASEQLAFARQHWLPQNLVNED